MSDLLKEAIADGGTVSTIESRTLSIIAKGLKLLSIAESKNLSIALT